MKVKKRLCDGLILILCFLPVVCGFVSMYIQASWYLGRHHAKKLAEYVEKL